MNADPNPVFATARVALACLTLLAGNARGTQTLESVWRSTGDETVKVFDPVREVLQTSSAVILDGRDEVAYGVVISPEGHIITKASEISGKKKLAVMVDTTRFECQVLAQDEKWDVALLKIPATGLVPVRYADNSKLEQGTWVVANGVSSRTKRRALAGIISAKAREIPPEGGGVLGIQFKQDVKEAVVEEVPEKSGAAEAGIKPGDIIVAVRGKKVATPMDLAELGKTLKVGDMVPVTYRRKGAETTVDVRVVERAELFKDSMPESRNDMMSGRVSERRGGFPRVIQHDILGEFNTVGGPLLDLDGRCVGMNIARADRAQSFAIPVEELQEIAKRLMAGK